MSRPRKVWPHGTAERYRQGCSEGAGGRACRPCLEAHGAYMRTYREVRRRQGRPITQVKPCPPHGTARRARSTKCPCDCFPCREALKLREAELAAVGARVGGGRRVGPHGTYSRGRTCRCEVCAWAGPLYQRDRRAGVEAGARRGTAWRPVTREDLVALGVVRGDTAVTMVPVDDTLPTVPALAARVVHVCVAKARSA